MTRRRTPQEKKHNEYTKDYSTPSSHGFRQSLPREKARANRAYRRQVHQRVDTFEAYQGDTVPERLSSAQVRRKRVQKDYGVAPMGEVIERRLEGRIERIAQTTFFRHEYNSVRDRERFADFLAAQVRGRTETSRNLALYLNKLMYPPPQYENKYLPRFWEKNQQWFRSFFQDEPEWEVRLRTWIASFEQE